MLTTELTKGKNFTFNGKTIPCYEKDDELYFSHSDLKKLGDISFSLKYVYPEDPTLVFTYIHNPQITNGIPAPLRFVKGSVLQKLEVQKKQTKKIILLMKTLQDFVKNYNEIETQEPAKEKVEEQKENITQININELLDINNKIYSTLNEILEELRSLTTAWN